MNKEDIIELLESILADIRFHPELIGEILSICAESGIEAKFVSTLVARLNFLSQMGVLATRHKEFEPISDGLYSMHIAIKGGNLRILYAFLSDRSPILLLCFHERGGKQRTNYSTHVPTALARLEKYKKGV